jgi:TolB protein
MIQSLCAPRKFFAAASRLTRHRVSALIALSLSLAVVAQAQDTTSRRGVRIGLTYQPGTKPGVAVLPVAGEGGDSVQAILARDLDYSDRVEVMGLPGTAARSVLTGTTPGAVSYPLWKSLGAAAVVQATMTTAGVRVALHDVAAASVMQTRDFPVTSSRTSPEWRLDVHAISDEILKWITGTRGIAATRLLYVRGGRVYVIDSDGEGERALTQSGAAVSPAWHPSGGQIAYSVFGDHGTRIVVRDMRTGQARQVAGQTGLNITPTFSPDGSTLAYAHGDENGTDLVLTDAAGGSPGHRITVGRGTDNVSPSYSPDGRHIAFTSGRSGHPEVYTADVDGANVELLTSVGFGSQSYRSNPDWSPDGRLVAFQAQLGGRFQIMTISLRDRSVKQLTSEGINEDPAWAPDGRHLVFTSSRTGVKQLWILDTESGRVRQLTHTPGARLGAWSRWLAGTP